MITLTNAAYKLKTGSPYAASRYVFAMCSKDNVALGR
jgi:hypothetical protein